MPAGTRRAHGFGPTEALVGSILELARLADTPPPSIQAVYACVKLLNKVMLTEGGGVRLSKAA